MASAIIGAMTHHDVRRLVLTSTLGEGDSTANTPFPVKVLLATFLRGATRDKAAMEGAARNSDLDWVITRPAVLTDKPATGNIRIYRSPSAERAHSITRIDLASFLLDQLTSNDNLRNAVTIANR